MHKGPSKYAVDAAKDAHAGKFKKGMRPDKESKAEEKMEHKGVEKKMGMASTMKRVMGKC